VQKLGFLGKVTNDFKKPKGSHRGELASRFRDIEAEADVALSGQMVNFMGDKLYQQPPNRRDVIEIRVMEKQRLVVDGGVAGEMIDAAAGGLAAATNQAMHDVPLLQQELGQVRTVLTGNAGDQRGFWGQDIFSFSVFGISREDKLSAVRVLRPTTNVSERGSRVSIDLNCNRTHLRFGAAYSFSCGGAFWRISSWQSSKTTEAP